MKEKGVTLVEIVISIFLIVLFSAILISDFPRILKQFALTRAVYKLAVDLRRIEDLGFSGVLLQDKEGNSLNPKGYGVYFDLANNESQYILYIDRGDSYNAKYDNISQFCQENEDPYKDCILEIIDVKNENPNVFIKQIRDKEGDEIYRPLSVNFTPPIPFVNIVDHEENTYSEVEIVLGLKFYPNVEKSVIVNKGGLIYIKY